MARPRIAFSRVLLLLLGVALQPAIMAVPGNAQAAEGGSSITQLPPSGANLASSINKAGATAQGGGPVIVPGDISQLRIEPGDLLSDLLYLGSGNLRLDLLQNALVALA